MTDNLSLARELVAKGLNTGAEQIEVYVTKGQELTVKVANGQVETLKNAEEQGVGIRVFVANRLGYAYSSDLSSTALETALTKAIFNAKKTAEDSFNILPRLSDVYPELDLYDPEIAKVSVEEKIKMALLMEDSARGYDPRVKIIESCTYQDVHYQIAIVNSKGIEKTNEGSYCGMYAFVVAEEGSEAQTGFDLQFELKIKDLNPVKIGKEAANKAVRSLGAKHVETQKATVVLDPYVATNFLGVLASAFSAENVQKGKSFFAGKMNTIVCSPLVEIIDDGALVGKVVSSPFDGEGVAMQRTILVKEGILTGLLHNSYTANKGGTASTGNAIRSYKGTPEVGATNLYIEAGQVSKEVLLSEVRQGFYITEVMGMHTANPISGDFSVGASGLLIENGKLTKAFRGAAIAGNLIGLLKQVDCVADDLTFFIGSGSPTIRIANMTISGS
ncbi:MAG: TldD/PmbA family protein [Bacillota bacterium]